MNPDELVERRAKEILKFLQKEDSDILNSWITLKAQKYAIRINDVTSYYFMIKAGFVIILPILVVGLSSFIHSTYFHKCVDAHEQVQAALDEQKRSYENVSWHVFAREANGLMVYHFQNDLIYCTKYGENGNAACVLK